MIPATQQQPELTVVPGRKRNPRRYWRPLLIVMLLIEWVVDLVREIITVIHNSVKVLTLTLKSYIDEHTRPQSGG